MADCMPRGTAVTAADSPLTPPRDEATYLASGQGEKVNEMHRIRQEQQQRDHDVEEAASLLNGKNYIGQTPTKGDEAEARKIARAWAKQLNADIKASAERYKDRAQELVNLVQGTSVARGSYWSNLKNTVYKAFVSSNAEVNKFLAHFAHMDELPAQYANQFIRMFERIPAIARNINSQFLAQRDNILNACIPLANRCGMDARDFYVLAGHWQLCRHMPERNNYILKRWREELAKMEADPDARNSVQYFELEQKINNLERFRNSDLTDFDAETFGEIYHGGYTDKQAADFQEQILRETGATREELDQIGDMFTQAFNHIFSERVRLGLVDASVQIPEEFAHYVPALSRSSEGFNNFTGAPNDATPYNPGSYYAIEGRTSAPDSPAITLGFYGQRAAAEIATRDFGFVLNAIEQSLKKKGVDSHLRSISYKDLMRRMNASIGGPVAEAARTLYNRGGMVATVPREYTSKKTGKTRIKWEKRFFFFAGDNFMHNGTKFDVDSLNKGISASFKTAETGPLVDLLRKGTSTMGQLTTRFSPLFSPVSGTRDFTERAFNMANRTYMTEDGKTLNGASLVGSFLANSTRAGQAMAQVAFNHLDPNSTTGRYWKEFTDQGLVQEFTQNLQLENDSITDLLSRRQEGGSSLVETLAQHQSTEKLAEKLKMNTPVLNKFRNSFGKRQGQVLNVINRWNDSWQNVAAFSHYITLREKGVRASDAADYVMEMMNMSQKGTLAPWLQALAPFVVPTVQSGTAFLRTMGFGADTMRGVLKNGWKGWLALGSAYGAYAMLMPMIKESMGYDEEGNSRFDAMPLSEVSQVFPIGLGDNGEYFRAPIGFGFPQLGALIAVGSERMAQGRLSPSDFAFEIMFSVMKNIAPGNWPEYDFADKPSQYIMSMLTPQPFRPILETATNTNYFGNSLYRDSFSDTDSRADSGRTATPRIWHNAARWMRDTLGIDTYPEAIQNTMRGYALGPFRFFMSWANQADDIYKGSSRPSALNAVHPLLAAMGITSWMGKVSRPEQALYYESKRHYDDKIRNLGVKIAAPRDQDAETYKRNVLAEAGFTPEEVDDFITIWKAQTALQQQGREFNAQYKDRWRSMDNSEELRMAFDDLDEASQQIYNAAIQQLHYYNG